MSRGVNCRGSVDPLTNFLRRGFGMSPISRLYDFRPPETRPSSFCPILFLIVFPPPTSKKKQQDRMRRPSHQARTRDIHGATPAGGAECPNRVKSGRAFARRWTQKSEWLSACLGFAGWSFRTIRMTTSMTTLMTGLRGRISAKMRSSRLIQSHKKVLRVQVTHKSLLRFCATPPRRQAPPALRRGPIPISLSAPTQKKGAAIAAPTNY